MQIYTQEALATQLQKIFAGHRPRVIYDVTDKGENIMEFLIENPHNPRFSIVFQAQGRHQQVDVCTLRFGQAEIKGMMEPEMVPSAITTILNDELVAIVQYKNDEAYDNRRSIPNLEWLYQLTDDEDDDSTALEKMKQKLSTPPSFFDKLRGNMIGIFEIFSWSSSEIIKR